MRRWQYEKINLNDLPRKIEDVDLLNDAGKEGWELVGISPNSMAYLKRLIEKNFPEGNPPPARRKR